MPNPATSGRQWRPYLTSLQRLFASWRKRAIGVLFRPGLGSRPSIESLNRSTQALPCVLATYDRLKLPLAPSYSRLLLGSLRFA